MIETAVDHMRRTRQTLAQNLADLPIERMLVVPDGFRNNVLWNLGHIIVSQQGLHYRLAGLPMYVSKEQIYDFRRGSDPASWKSTPDVELLMKQLVELPDRLLVDYREGRFQDFTEYSTPAGPTLRTIEEAVVFNNWHEGYHTGIIAAQRRLVT